MKEKRFDLFRNFRRKAPAEVVLSIFVSFVFFLVAASYIYILVWQILSGFKTHTEIVMDPFGLPEVWHWEHYIEVFQIFGVNGHGFFEMLFNSCYFSIVGVFLGMFSSCAFSYCCTKYKFPGSRLVYPIILIMITLPLYGSSGAMYKLLHSLGLVDSYAQIITAIAGFNMNFLYFSAYYRNLSLTYAEAAQIDGANDFQIFFKVMFPLSKPIFGALFLMGWLGNWNSYESALVYLPNHPTLPVGIYQFNTEMIYRARLDILFAACFIVCLPALILFIIFNKTITTNVSLGGIKG